MAMRVEISRCMNTSIEFNRDGKHRYVLYDITIWTLASTLVLANYLLSGTRPL